MLKGYVINLARSKARWAKVQQLQRAGFSLTRIEAVDGKYLHTSDYHNIVSSLTMQMPEIACVLSHRKAWQAILDSGDHYGIVLEDDAITYASSDVIRDQIEIAMLKRPDLDILYLGKCYDQCTQYQHVDGNVFSGSSPYCLHAYLVTVAGAKKLLAATPVAAPVDMHVAGLITRKYLNSLVVHPSLITQDVVTTNSELRSSKLALNNITECGDAPGVKTASQQATMWALAVICIILVIILLFYSRPR